MKFYFGCWLSPAIASPSFAQNSAPVQITSNSWTVVADSIHSTFQISFRPLNALVGNVRLGLKSDSLLRIEDGWTAARVAPDQLNIHTSNPESGWAIVALPDGLRISCTHVNAVSGDVPISPRRFVARLLDPQGTPVSCVGTKEVKETYGAAEVRNPSLLPGEDPEVMYFGLGQIASPLFHSLFDQPTDTAIDSPLGTVLAKTAAADGMFSLSMPVPGNAMIRIKADYDTKTLSLPFYVPFDDSYFNSAPMVWSSWTSYYEDVTEKDLFSNTDWIAKNQKPYGFQYVELDNRYDPQANGQHKWIGGWNRNKFSNGPEWLTAYIKDKGLQAGIWLVPNAYAGALETHPDWYLHYKTGKVVLDYNTPALDSTNPEVLNFVQKLFTTFDDWGFTYDQFDGEHTVLKIVPNIDQAKIYDRSIDSVLAYRNKLLRIRTKIGQKRYIEVCPAGSPLDGIGYISSYFNGHGLYDNWHGMYSLFGSINGNSFLNKVVVHVMPGEGISVGPPTSVEEAQQKRFPAVLDTEKQREFPLTGLGVNDAEARTVLTHVALTGVAYALASVMPELSPDRIKMLQMTLPTRPIVPIDLFSCGSDVQWDTFKHLQSTFYIHNFPEVVDSKVNANLDDYDVVAVTNWRDQPLSKRVSFAVKLGLNTDDTFLAFDFWNQEFVETFNSFLDLKLDPHDTRVLFLRKMLERPQIIGSSRHITGEFSLSGVSWDGAGDSLQGTSEIVPSDPCSKWLFIPVGFQFVKAHEDKGRDNSAII